MNERTHFFWKIYLPHFILERVAKGLMLVVCERWVGDGDRLLHIDLKFFFNHSSTSFAFWLAAQPWVTLASCLQLAPTAAARLTQAVCGTWLYNCFTPTCFLWAYCTKFNHVHRSRSYSNIFNRMHLFYFLLLIYSGASLDWRLSQGSICYNYFALISNSTCTKNLCL